MNKNKRSLLMAIKALAFDQQLKFLEDKSKRKALFVGRRGGKTEVVVILFLLYALMHSNIRLIFIGLTGDTAEKAFRPKLLSILNKFDLPDNYNHTERFWTFDNGSTISLKGFDVSYKEMDKILGGNCFAVAIDECQSHTQDIDKAIKFKIGPAVSDYLPMGGGLIILLGTAGDYLGEHFWYQITREDNLTHSGWSMHSWLDKVNPHMLEAKLIEDAQFKAQYGELFSELPWYQQQYLCKWIINRELTCYNFNKDKNLIVSLPVSRAKYEYDMGLDLGFEDDNAFVIYAQNRYDSTLYIPATFRKNHMTVSEIAAQIKTMMIKYPCRKILVDTGGGGKTIAETLKKEYGLPIYPADKSGDKKSRIARMNDYLTSGRIKVLPGNELLLAEWDTLKWNKKLMEQGIWQEGERYKNHLGDAALYGFTETYAYLAKPSPTTPQFPHSDLFYQVKKQDRARDAKLSKSSKWQDKFKF